MNEKRAWDVSGLLGIIACVVLVGTGFYNFGTSQGRMPDAAIGISHLAYAPEIASTMLQRQQAQAIISARTKIVDGAVGMVQMALANLEKNGIVKLDEERRAAMVSNLLVVLCSERPTQPVLNTGSIY